MAHPNTWVPGIEPELGERIQMRSRGAGWIRRLLTMIAFLTPLSFFPLAAVAVVDVGTLDLPAQLFRLQISDVSDASAPVEIGVIDSSDFLFDVEASTAGAHPEESSCQFQIGGIWFRANNAPTNCPDVTADSYNLGADGVFDNNGTPVAMNFNGAAAVPEPGTAMLVILGLLSLGLKWHARFALHRLRPALETAENVPRSNPLRESRMRNSSRTSTRWQPLLLALLLASPLIALSRLAHAEPIDCGDVEPGIGPGIRTFMAGGGERVSIALSQGVWELYDPSNSKVGPTCTTKFCDAILPQVSGTYEIRISGGAQPFSYDIGLQFLSGVGVCGSPISCDAPESAATTHGVDTDVYTFTADGGERVNIALDKTSSAGEIWQLFDPEGNLVDPVGSPAGGECRSGFCDAVLPNTPGTYVFRVFDNHVDQSFSYDVALQFLSGARVCGSPISCDDPESAETTHGVDTDVYTFTADGGERVSIALDKTSSAGEIWQLFDPEGNLVDPVGSPAGGECRSGFCDAVLPNTPGTYTVRVYDDHVDQSFSYDVALQFLSGARVCGSPISCDHVESAETTHGVDTDVYTFTADGGERVNIALDKTSSAGEIWQLFDPEGNLVDPVGSPAGGECRSGFCDAVLPNTAGTYTVRVYDDHVDQSFSYNLTLQGLSEENTCGKSSDCINVLAGEFEVVSETDTYVFDAEAGDEVIITLTETCGDVVQERWDLYSPSGMPVVEDCPFECSSGILQESGTYTVLAYESGLDQTGLYTFAVQGVDPGFPTCSPADRCPFGVDDDGDGVCDDEDTCVPASLAQVDIDRAFNPAQRDTDADGYGNRCDGDYNNVGIVGVPAFNTFRSAFGTSACVMGFDPDTDHIGNGVIGIPAFNMFRDLFGRPPGPSGLSCAGTVPCPAP
jgi:hypothetical protein